MAARQKTGGGVTDISVERDAARYRWLRANLETLVEWMDNDIQANKLDRTIDGNLAIDAAMRQSEKQEDA